VVLAQSLGPASASLFEDAPRALGAGGAVEAVFPPAVVKALEALDPREAFKVEFVRFEGGEERVAGAYLEVGDLEAAQAFLAAAR
jgi:hypothetical protein